MKYFTPYKATVLFVAIAISSLLFGCTKQKSEPMTNIWVSPYYISNWLYNAEGKYLHTGADGEITADSTMEILRESTWPMGVTATMPKYLIPDTEKLRFEVTSKNAWMRVDSDKIYLLIELMNEADDQWLELTTTGFRLKGKVTSYNARGYFKQAVFPSIDEFYYDLAGGQESDLQVETTGYFPVGNGRLQIGFLLRQLVHALLGFLGQYSGLNGPNEV